MDLLDENVGLGPEFSSHGELIAGAEFVVHSRQGCIELSGFGQVAARRCISSDSRQAYEQSQHRKEYFFHT